MKKVTLMLSLAGLVSLSTSSFAQEATTNTALAQQISALQAQMDQLKKEVNKNDAKEQAADYDSVSIGPYIGINPEYNGWELVVNSLSINKDVNLLNVRKKQRADYAAQGLTNMEQPRLIFSGYLEGQASYQENYTGDNTSDIDLTAAELDTFIEASQWLTGFAAFVYDNGAGDQADRVNNANMELSQGFITIGDLDRTPFYSSVGQLYVPFGSYAGYMITDPLTKTLGRIKARALVLGYTSDKEGLSPYASTYAYQGSTEVDGDDTNSQIHQYGFNVGTKFAKNDWSGRFGASYTSNIADSSGMQGDSSDGSEFVGFGQSSTTEDLSKEVPGVDVYGLIGRNGYTFITEYATAATKFDSNDMTFNGEAAQPQALDVQLVREFNHWNRPNFIALDYGQSWQALALGVPQHNVGTTYGISVWEHTILSLELMHNWGYSAGSTATGAGMAVDTSQVGESYNSATLQLDMYF